MSQARIAHIDALKKEWGLRNRGDVLERLLEELFSPNPSPSIPDASTPTAPTQEDDLLDDCAALVLVGLGQGAMEGWRLDAEGKDSPDPPQKKRKTAGRESTSLDLFESGLKASKGVWELVPKPISQLMA